MNWIEGISEAINYIEANLENDLKIEDIAGKAFVSSFCFQKSFSMLCGFTVGEYIRNRRLASAGNDLLTTDENVTAFHKNFELQRCIQLYRTTIFSYSGRCGTMKTSECFCEAVNRFVSVFQSNISYIFVGSK